MESFMRMFFMKKVGEFLRVDEGDCHFSATGELSIRRAGVREEVFDGLHLPITLRGGFIDEISVNFSMGMWSATSAKVVVKDVFLVFGPHETDWSWSHVYECKSKLVDLIAKLFELKPPKKKKASAGTYFAGLQKKVADDFAQKFLGMLEVHISNVHFRYEDAVTQAKPLACGFKIGFVGVTSQADPETLRTTGDWRHSSGRYADPFFCQSIATRRISAYWDVGLCNLFATGPVSGQDVKRNFVRLNLRETFSACVVDEILSLFPPEHRRRQYLEGPCFRERLDFHQYVVFPASLKAHVTVNRVCDATQSQKAPLKDVDVIFDSLEAALDSEQVASMNELLSYTAEFKRKDCLLRTRPDEAIGKYLPISVEMPRRFSSSSASMKLWQQPSPLPDPDAERRSKLVRAWWRHAFQGVRLLSGIPKSHLDAAELRWKARLREEYVGLCMEELAAAEEAAQDQRPPSASLSSSERPDVHRLRSIQMMLPLKDILDWRLLARVRRQEKLKTGSQPTLHEEELEAAAAGAREAVEVEQATPNTMQARLHFKAFQAFFLVVADHNWTTATYGSGILGSPSSPAAGSRSGTKSPTRAKPRRMTRELVVKAQVLDVRMDAVQKGRGHHRVARWLELGVGSISATNCNVKKLQQSARQIISIAPVEQQRLGMPVCAFMGLTTLEAVDHNVEPGDVPLAAVLEPWEGLASHVKTFPRDDGPEQLRRMGLLRDGQDDIGKFMTFAFVRVGQVRAVDYTPFRRRVLHFLTRGMKNGKTNLVRRPSPLALDRELLLRLQRKVEKLTGKSNMLGVIEGVMDGVSGRLVDHYNSQHVLCKEVSLAAMRWKALRSGSPQAFHLQLHQIQPSGAPQRAPLASSLLAAVQGDGAGLLPWKVAMLLLPKADFAMGIEPAVDTARAQTRRDDASALGKLDDPVKAADPAAVLLAGASFWKWGRSGRPKRRFVIFDECLDAIVWKNGEKDRQPLGVIPLAKVQDICTGVETPVLQRVRSPKLRTDRVWSVVATDRTLDLQAESVAHQQRWVAALKARYKRHVQRQSIEGDVCAQLPRALERRSKAYPERFRSQRCALLNTYQKLQAVTSIGRTLGGPSTPRTADSQGSTRGPRSAAAPALGPAARGSARERGSDGMREPVVDSTIRL